MYQQQKQEQNNIITYNNLMLKIESGRGLVGLVLTNLFLYLTNLGQTMGKASLSSTFLNGLR
ncbi:hypothetical protein D7154_11465 [Vibrio cholerae]|nr:hypothetical protein [Vibrio cholerae]EGR2398035.1 hypothetical protein [Vibrio cholerae]EGR2401773.1 hypothetical protein [Vibrio cholerae]